MTAILLGPARRCFYLQPPGEQYKNRTYNLVDTPSYYNREMLGLVLVHSIEMLRFSLVKTEVFTREAPDPTDICSGNRYRYRTDITRGICSGQLGHMFPGETHINVTPAVTLTCS